MLLWHNHHPVLRFQLGSLGHDGGGRVVVVGDDLFVVFSWCCWSCWQYNWHFLVGSRGHNAQLHRMQLCLPIRELLKFRELKRFQQLPLLLSWHLQFFLLIWCRSVFMNYCTYFGQPLLMCALNQVFLIHVLQKIISKQGFPYNFHQSGWSNLVCSTNEEKRPSSAKY